jgi:PAS domain S-box-containing protein
VEKNDILQRIFEDTKERAHYLSKIIWSSPGFMYVKDTSSRYVACNENFAKAAGVMCPEDIIGKKDYELAWESFQAQSLRTGDVEVLTGASHINFEESQLQNDGLYRTVLANKIPIYDDLGKVIGIFGNYFDITERKKQEKDLLNAKKQAEEANKAKSEIVANISHDLRTPLSAILGMTDAALNSQDPEIYREALVGVLESGKNLLNLIEDILTYASVEHTQEKNKYSSFALNELIEGIRLSTETNAQKKGLEFIVENQFKKNQYVYSDKLSIRRIIVNLIGNAIKFTEKGSVHVILYAGPPSETCPDLMTLNITIKDTGIGMQKKDLGKIFDRFSRLSPTYVLGNMSSGLGLTIVQDLLLKLQGSIRVESEPAQGTTFHCKIPLHFIATPQSIMTNKKETNEKIPFQNQASTIKVLVVEDSKPIRLAMAMLLKHLGSQLTFATTGEEALAKPINDFDIVLMDLSLGDLTGLEVTRALRKKFGNSTPIIALTAHALEKDKEACLSAGMNDFITKPVLLETLKQLFIKFNLL